MIVKYELLRKILCAASIATLSVCAMQEESWLQSAKNKLYSTRLFAGYHYTPVQKEEAYAKIRELLYKKDKLQRVLISANASKKEKDIAEDRLIKINDEIYVQKLITGDKWTTTRKLVMGTLGLGGLVGLGIVTYPNKSVVTPAQNQPTTSAKPKTGGHHFASASDSASVALNFPNFKMKKGGARYVWYLSDVNQHGMITGITRVEVHDLSFIPMGWPSGNKSSDLYEGGNLKMSINKTNDNYYLLYYPDSSNPSNNELYVLNNGVWERKG